MEEGESRREREREENICLLLLPLSGIRTLFAGSSCNDAVAGRGLGTTVISGHFDRRIRFWDTRTATANEIALQGRVTSLDHFPGREECLLWVWPGLQGCGSECGLICNLQGGVCGLACVGEVGAAVLQGSTFDCFPWCS